MKLNIEEVVEFINNQGPGTKIYIGADSEKFIKNDQWWAEYTIAVVVHIDGSKGCKIFGETAQERDYDQKLDKPTLRLMNEVYRASEMYQRLQPLIQDRDIEVHLDISPDKSNGSSCVVQQAIGYIRGTCNIVPMVKPDAFAASYAADRLKSLKTG